MLGYMLGNMLGAVLGISPRVLRPRPRSWELVDAVLARGPSMESWHCSPGIAVLARSPSTDS